MRLQPAALLAGTALLIAACAAPPPETPPAPVEMHDRAAVETNEADAAVVTSVTGSRQDAALQARAELEMRAAKQALYGVVAPAANWPCCVPNVSVDTERYEHFDESPVHVAVEDPVSTFSIDVDTGSYTNVRRFLTAGQLPPQDAVRVEEMLNYFDYQYAAPKSLETPFAVTTELGHAPWNTAALLLRIGIRGYAMAPEERPPANLVFLIDVSGSMQSPDKLPLLRNAFRLLVDQLDARDRVSMVVYAGASGVILAPWR